MKAFIVTYLPWLLSLITVVMTHVVGRKDHRGWLLGLVNQLLWLIWIVISENWGFILLNLMLWHAYFKNYRAWKREQWIP
jgi:hypothetical protein